MWRKSFCIQFHVCYMFHFLSFCRQSQGKLNLFFSFSLLFQRRYFTVRENVVFSNWISFQWKSKESFSLFSFGINLDTAKLETVFPVTSLFFYPSSAFSSPPCLFIVGRNKYYLKQQIVILNRFRNWKSSNKISCNHFRETYETKKRSTNIRVRVFRNAQNEKATFPIIIIITIDFPTPFFICGKFSLLHILAETTSILFLKKSERSVARNELICWKHVR